MGQKKSADDHVIPFYESPYFDYRPYDRSMVRIQQACRKWLTTTLGREDFDFLYSKHLLELTGSRPDLVHCQNLHGGYFDLRVLAEISHQVPLFLTLHDCWSFTGHCAHSFDCERWQTGCGSCPYLSNPPAVRAIARDGTGGASGIFMPAAVSMSRQPATGSCSTLGSRSWRRPSSTARSSHPVSI